jgi:hypoxanthine phosphoribosyltransferase
MQYKRRAYDWRYLSHHLGDTNVGPAVDGCLIVDDINDTGKTLSHIVNTNSGKFKIATFHMKSQSIIKSDYYVKLEEPESWIVYPYEV